MRPQGTAAELEARRLRAAGFFREKKSSTDVATLCGVDISSVKRWKRAWKQGGVAALAARPHPGPQAKLTAKQKLQLVELLKQGPRAAGYRTELWTCRRVAQLVRKKFGVTYHPDHLGRILHDLGFTPQKPKTVARERDEAAIAHWRRYTWPSLKNELAANRQPLSLSMNLAFVCSR